MKMNKHYIINQYNMNFNTGKPCPVISETENGFSYDIHWQHDCIGWQLERITDIIFMLDKHTQEICVYSRNVISEKVAKDYLFSTSIHYEFKSLPAGKYTFEEALESLNKREDQFS